MFFEEVDIDGKVEERILQQFRSSTNIKALIKGLMDPVKSTQEDLLHLTQNLNLETAEGFFLDNIGNLVGVLREGRDDDDYRDAIKLGVVLNNSSGTLPEVSQLVKSFSGSSSVRTFEHETGMVIFAVDSDNYIDELPNIVRQALPLGVDCHILINNGNGSPEPGDYGYRFAEVGLFTFDVTNMTDDTGNSIVDNEGDNIGIAIRTNTFAEDSILGEVQDDGSIIGGKPLAEVY